jgi:hypothetical protein
VLFTGTTASTAASFSPISWAGAYNQGFNGGLKDAFLGKLASTPWLTYYGGSGDDFGNTIVIRPSNNNILIGGSTGSSTPECVACFCAVPSTVGQFPLCPKTNAYFQGSTSTGAVYNGGTSDGFLSEFTNAGVFNWGTYRGGNNADLINSLAIGGISFITPNSSTENIIAVGETFSNSASLSQPSSPAVDPSFYLNGVPPPNNGNSDGLFALLDNDNDLLYTDWCMGAYQAISGPSTVTPDPNHINSYASAVSVWNHHIFIAETTTNNQSLIRISNGMDAMGAVGVYQDAQNWEFNGGQMGFDPATVNSDAYFIRMSQKDMPMVMPGIAEKYSKQIPEFLVFPNPSQGIYNIKTDNMDIKGASIFIVDILGRTVYTEAKIEFLSGHLKTIDLSSVTSGLYFICIKTNSFSKTLRVIKQ